MHQSERLTFFFSLRKNDTLDLPSKFKGKKKKKNPSEGIPKVYSATSLPRASPQVPLLSSCVLHPPSAGGLSLTLSLSGAHSGTLPLILLSPPLPPLPHDPPLLLLSLLCFLRGACPAVSAGVQV